jgi:hypothetical protein
MNNYNYVVLNRLFNGKEEEGPRLTDVAFAKQYILNAPSPLHRKVTEEGFMGFEHPNNGWLLLQKEEKLSPFISELAAVNNYAELVANTIDQQKFLAISELGTEDISLDLEEEFSISDEYILLTSKANEEKIKFPEGSTIIDLEEYLNLENIEETEFHNKVYAIRPGSICGTLQINRNHSLDDNDKLFPIITVERNAFGYVEVKIELQFSINIENPNSVLCFQLV